MIGIVTTAIAGWGSRSPESSRRAFSRPGSYEQATNDGILSMLLSVQYDFTPLFWGFVEGLGMITDDPIIFVLVVFTFFFVDFFDTAGRSSASLRSPASSTRVTSPTSRSH